MYTAYFRFSPHVRMVEEDKNIDLDVTLDVAGNYTYHADDGSFMVRRGVDLTDDIKRQEMETRLSQSMDCTVNLFWAEHNKGIKHDEIDDYNAELTAAIINDLKGGFCLNNGIALDDLVFTKTALCDKDENIYQTFCTEFNRRAELEKIVDRIKELEDDAEHKNEHLAEINQLKRRMQEILHPVPAPSPSEAPDSKPAQAVQNNEGQVKARSAFFDTTPNYVNRNERMAPKTKYKWYCPCGKINDTNYCTGCGKPKEATSVKWICSCGAYVSTPFCTVCGIRRAW